MQGDFSHYQAKGRMNRPRSTLDHSLRARTALPLLALLLLLPPLLQAFDSDFYIGVASRILIFALAATSLNLILGFGGMVSFGHAAFVGVGAYAVGILMQSDVTSAWVAWPAAMAAGGAFALLIGAISLRTRGVYFIMITLAFAQMLYYLMVSLKHYGGEDGMTLMQRSDIGLGVDLSSDLQFYYVVLAMFVLAFLGIQRLLNARFGHALQGVRENETRMQALGFPVYACKLAAFTLSGALAALAGALLANQASYVSPALMQWNQSGMLMIMVILGGVGYLYGGLAGAVAFLLIEEILVGYTIHWQFWLGGLLLAVVLLAPNGLLSLADRLGRLGRRHGAATPAGDSAPDEAGRTTPGAPDDAVAPHGEPDHSAVPSHVNDRVEPAGPAVGNGGVCVKANPGVVGDAIADGGNAQADSRQACTPVLSAQRLVKRFGGLAATDHADLQVWQGELHALIGPNGAGKTTLIHQLSGAMAPTSGRILFMGQDVTRLPMHRRVRLGLVRSYQITSVFPRLSVLDNLALAVQACGHASLHPWRAARADAAQWDAACRMAARVGLADRGDWLAGSLSHGERRQLEVGLALILQPRLLLLDEPMAGMGAEESARMLRLLQDLKGSVTILLVEHDMDAVFQLADRISTLVAGRIIATGTPEEIRNHPEVQRAYLGDEDADAGHRADPGAVGQGAGQPHAQEPR